MSEEEAQKKEFRWSDDANDETSSKLMRRGPDAPKNTFIGLDGVEHGGSQPTSRDALPKKGAMKKTPTTPVNPKPQFSNPDDPENDALMAQAASKGWIGASPAAVQAPLVGPRPAPAASSSSSSSRPFYTLDEQGEEHWHLEDLPMTLAPGDFEALRDLIAQMEASAREGSPQYKHYYFVDGELWPATSNGGHLAYFAADVSRIPRMSIAELKEAVRVIHNFGSGKVNDPKQRLLDRVTTEATFNDPSRFVPYGRPAAHIYAILFKHDPTRGLWALLEYLKKDNNFYLNRVLSPNVPYTEDAKKDDLDKVYVDTMGDVRNMIGKGADAFYEIDGVRVTSSDGKRVLPKHWKMEDIQEAGRVVKTDRENGVSVVYFTLDSMPAYVIKATQSGVDQYEVKSATLASPVGLHETGLTQDQDFVKEIVAELDAMSRPQIGDQKFQTLEQQQAYSEKGPKLAEARLQRIKTENPGLYERVVQEFKKPIAGEIKDPVARKKALEEGRASELTEGSKKLFEEMVKNAKSDKTFQALCSDGFKQFFPFSGTVFDNLVLRALVEEIRRNHDTILYHTLDALTAARSQDQYVVGELLANLNAFCFGQFRSGVVTRPGVLGADDFLLCLYLGIVTYKVLLPSAKSQYATYNQILTWAKLSSTDLSVQNFKNKFSGRQRNMMDAYLNYLVTETKDCQMTEAFQVFTKSTPQVQCKNYGIWAKVYTMLSPGQRRNVAMQIVFGEDAPQGAGLA